MDDITGSEKTDTNEFTLPEKRAFDDKLSELTDEEKQNLIKLEKDVNKGAITISSTDAISDEYVPPFDDKLSKLTDEEKPNLIKLEKDIQEQKLIPATTDEDIGKSKSEIEKVQQKEPTKKEDISPPPPSQIPQPSTQISEQPMHDTKMLFFYRPAHMMSLTSMFKHIDDFEKQMKDKLSVVRVNVKNNPKVVDEFFDEDTTCLNKPIIKCYHPMHKTYETMTKIPSSTQDLVDFYHKVINAVNPETISDSYVDPWSNNDTISPLSSINSQSPMTPSLVDPLTISLLPKQLLQVPSQRINSKPEYRSLVDEIGDDITSIFHTVTFSMFKGFGSKSTNNRKTKIIYYRMDGCPHCEKFDSTWNRLSQSNSLGGSDIEFLERGVTNGIKYYPTLHKEYNGQVKEYQGKGNSLGEIIHWITEK